MEENSENVRMIYLGNHNFNSNNTTIHGLGATHRYIFYVPHEEGVLLARSTGYLLEDFSYWDMQSAVGKQVEEIYNKGIMERASIREMTPIEREEHIKSLDEFIANDVSKRREDIEKSRLLDSLQKRKEINQVFSHKCWKGYEWRPINELSKCIEIEFPSELLNNFRKEYNRYLETKKNLEKLDRELDKTGLGKLVNNDD